jgi:hypothetical protein
LGRGSVHEVPFRAEVDVGGGSERTTLYVSSHFVFFFLSLFHIHD